MDLCSLTIYIYYSWWQKQSKRREKCKFDLIFHRLQDHLDVNYPMTQLFHKVHVQHLMKCNDNTGMHWNMNASNYSRQFLWSTIQNKFSYSMWTHLYPSSLFYWKKKSVFEILDLLKFEGRKKTTQNQESTILIMV